jgi:hypothetical protein
MCGPRGRLSAALHLEVLPPLQCVWHHLRASISVRAVRLYCLLPFPDDLLANRAALRATFRPKNLTEAVLEGASQGVAIKDRPCLRGLLPPRSLRHPRRGNISMGPAPHPVLPPEPSMRDYEQRTCANRSPLYQPREHELGIMPPCEGPP